MLAYGGFAVSLDDFSAEALHNLAIKQNEADLKVPREIIDACRASAESGNMFVGIFPRCSNSEALRESLRSRGFKVVYREDDNYLLISW